jgi:hypothetical protein
MRERKGVLVIVSIDTEEDNWYRSRRDVTLANIDELPRLAGFLERLGVRPTFFTTYHVATDRGAAAVLREVAGTARGELAAHLHPWNTPPLSEPFAPRNSMLKNLPAELQLAKLQSLTEALEAAFGMRPTAFRAGRYGLGRDTVAALLRCGYQVDSSVVPFVSWERFDDGPTFVDAPLDAYRLSPDRDVTQPAEDGDLIEVPLSCGFNHRPFAVWGLVRRTLEAPGLRRLRLVGLAARTGLCKRMVLSPEVASLREMVTLSRRLLDQGVRHLQLTWHSPSLVPGLGPFTATTADVNRLYASVAEYLERLSQITPLTFVTVSEAAGLLPERLVPKTAAC